MPTMQYAEYFLGANSPGGFRSFFADACPPAEGWQVWIIKGGPGTGKSTLMGGILRSAKEKGLFCEGIRCSSDPGSLDGVIIPSLRRAVFDGTAPHVLEPTLPGACETLVDLGRAWDKSLLRARREEISRLSAECSSLHRQASSMLACAAVFRERMSAPVRQAADLARIDRAARRLCERFGLDRPSGGAGKLTRRLASAVTPVGILNIAGDYIASFGRVVPVYDRSGAVSGLLLGRLRDLLLESGRNVIECTCSQEHTRTEHLLLPEEDICFTSRSDIHGGDSRTAADTRAVHTDRFLPAEYTRGRHPQRAADRRELLRFTGLACDCMSRARAVHDRLEECYKGAMNYDMVRQIGEEAEKEILEGGVATE